MNARPTLVWLRRDLRLADHPALTAALEAGGPVIPVFVLDPETEALGAAPKWRLGLSVADLQTRLRAMGSDLILRRGPAPETLRSLAAETGAGTVRWSRLHHPVWAARDEAVAASLAANGVEAVGHPGQLINEPGAVRTKTGGVFKVFTPFWRAALPLGAPEPLPPPSRLPAPAAWPASDRLEDWRLGAAMNRGAAVVARHVRVGEAAAQDRLAAFAAANLDAYATDRDRPDRSGTSRLSENLTYGEISPRTLWRAGARALAQGAPGAETFLKEVTWRDFAWHLLWNAPRMETEHWRADFEGFPFRGDSPEAERWRRALTGEPIVDAGLREMYVTGRMHNRVRMLVASYLTKHMLTHWRIGSDCFADRLVDWDPASNALGWQWAAGSGPDAAPFFRIFNPTAQAEKFDPEGRYRRRFLAGFDGSTEPEALAYFEAAPRSWGLRPDDPYPAPLVALQEGRAAALGAFRKHKAERKLSAGGQFGRTLRG